MAVPKLQTARKDYDLETCSPIHKTLDSTKNQFKVWMQGSGTVTIDAGATTNFINGTVIEHGLDYQPQVLVWVENPANGKWGLAPTAIASASGDLSGLTTDARGDGEYVLWMYNYSFPDLPAHLELTVNFEYIIFVEPVEDVWS